MFGVSVRPDGDVVVRPNALSFASRLALKGLKIRGRSLDVHVDKAHFEVRSHLQATRAAIGAAVVVSAKDGSLRLAALREDHQHSSGNP